MQEDLQEFLKDIVIVAIESGAITYWCDVLSYDPANGTAFIVEDEASEGEKPIRRKINPALMKVGIMRITKDPSVEIRKDILANILLGYRNRDAGEIDSEAADVIVQVAIFGEIIYG